MNYGLYMRLILAYSLIKHFWYQCEPRLAQSLSQSHRLFNQLKMNKAKILTRNKKWILVVKGPLDDKTVDIAADAPSVISLEEIGEIFTVPQA